MRRPRLLKLPGQLPVTPRLILEVRTQNAVGMFLRVGLMRAGDGASRDGGTRAIVFT